MRHITIDQILKRAENAKGDSDHTYFFSLLLAGEVLLKLTTLGFVAAVQDDKDRNRYRLEHTLVRADGLGDWGKVMEDSLSGPASQYLLADVRKEQSELTKLCGTGEWQHDAVVSLKRSLEQLKISAEEVTTKSDMKRWFRLFVTLRNGTRGHGATLPVQAGPASSDLLRSITLFASNHSLFKRPWAYLYRNLSGKYRVSPITDNVAAFDYLKKENDHALHNGVYLFISSPRYVPLVQSDPELQDFLFANGGMTGKRFELLSYCTDNKTFQDATAYLTPPGTLPPSETEGKGELVVKGKCFSNAPDLLIFA